MAIKFLHTADWQLGKPFGSIKGDAAAILREERFEAVRRIANIAKERQVDAVLVAGDVFDSPTVPEKVLRRAIEFMNGFDGPWVLLPGNHDAALSESPWTRLKAMGIPKNVICALDNEPILIADGQLAILPAPLLRRSEPDDATQWMDTADTPSDVMRVGLAHGTVANRLPEGEAHNEISDDRVTTANLDYLALGDWHGTMQIAPKTWYSGTPEPDRFPRNDPGNILIVEIDRRGSDPRIEKVATGRFQWRRCEVVCGADGEANAADAIEAAISAVANDPDVTLISLTLKGTTDLDGRHRIDESLNAWEARLRYLQRNLDGLIDEPSAADLDSIDKSGFVRSAVDRLKVKADNQDDPEQDVARTALRLLYLEHMAEPE